MAPRILYVVTEDWYFLSHRLPMARAAKAAGFEVHVAARIREGKTGIEAEGFVPHPLAWSRGSLSLRDSFAAVRQTSSSRLPSIRGGVSVRVGRTVGRSVGARGSSDRVASAGVGGTAPSVVGTPFSVGCCAFRPAGAASVARPISKNAVFRRIVMRYIASVQIDRWRKYRIRCGP